MIADNKEIKKRIIELQAKLNIIFPSLYIEFLAKINDGDLYEVENSGICLYSYSDLEERNKTYQYSCNVYSKENFRKNRGG